MPRKKATETPEPSETKPAVKRTTRKADPAPEPEPPKPKARAKRAVAQLEVAVVEVADPPKKTTRRKKAEEPIPEPDPAPKPRTRRAASKATPPDLAAVDEAKPKRARGTTKKDSVPDVVPNPVAEATGSKRPPRKTATKKPSPDPADGDLPILAWRTPTKTAKAEEEPKPKLAPRRSRKGEPITAAAAIAKPEEADEERSRRRRRRRRGRGGADEPTERRDTVEQKAEPTTEPILEPAFRKPKRGSEEPSRNGSPKAEPAKPVRNLVPIPADAPQVVLRDGIPTLVRDHRVFPPVFFFGSSLDERRAETVAEEMRLASSHGIHVFVHLVELVVDPVEVNDAVAFAGYLLKKSVETDPSCQVIFRIVFAAPDGWEKKFPKAKYIAEGGGVAEPSLCDDAFWGEAETCLRDFIVKLQKIDIGRHVMGLHLERGEWFFADGWGYDTSPAAFDKFREWVRLRYRDDVVSLRAAWFDGQVQFQTVSVPEYGHEPRAGEEFVRTGRKARRWVDYHLFLSDVTVERIGKLAYAVKEASQGYFLVGVSYGYTFEWSHPANGHLSLGKLLRTPEIDVIAGPPSYKNREPGGSAPFPCPIDSCALNGKLYISEEDFKTPFSGRQEPDDFNPVMRNPQALESVHWRGAGAATAHLAGVCWMDLWGNGWLNSPGIWNRAALVRDFLIQRMASPPGEPDVAVFIDERSLAYLVDQKAFRLLVQDVRESVLRSGLSVGFYLLSDLAHRERFPESKLYVFMNAWDIRPEVRGAIKSRLQRDGKVLFWLYAAGLFDGGRESLERVREVTGIALKPQPFASKPGTTLLNRRHPLCEALPESLLSGGGTLEPSYFAIPEDGLVLGEYSQTGLPSFVVREFKPEGSPSLAWTSVFLGEPIVTPGLFRALGQMAGAHVWNYQGDVVHVRPPFLTLHCTGSGPRTLTLPDKWSAYDLLGQQWAMLDATHLTYNGNDGATSVFLVGPRGEIEGLLGLDPNEWLTIEEITPRAENTLKLDSFAFDVPIMKLDEWMEESWSEDLAEDLLIKPSLLDLDSPEEEDVSAERSGRSRRRRGGRRRSGDDSDPSRREPATANDNDPFDNLGMNVVFRKRV